MPDVAVFDANVMAAMVLDLPYSDAAARVVSHYEGVTVEQSLAEVPSAIRRAVKLGAIDVAFARARLTTALSFARSMSMTGMEGDALSLALTLDHAVYDCFYLRLAEGLNVPFASADRKFLRKARTIATVPLLDLFDLPDDLP